MSTNTLFLRLEGPFQAWGDPSKFVIRRTTEAPTKSGVIGLLLTALGVERRRAAEEGWLKKFGNQLRMGVRIDRPGIRWWDYHTVGAKIGVLTAQGKIKRTASSRAVETLISRREYLCDASFLVALQGESALIADFENALKYPKWTLYLGRKCCPPSRPILEIATQEFTGLLSALKSIPWRPRYKGDLQPETIEVLLDWIPTAEEPEAPENAEIWYDVPDSFDPPSHHPRFVIRKTLTAGKGCEVGLGEPTQRRTPAPLRPRADYGNSKYKEMRDKRLDHDHHLCVFCKSPLLGRGATVQHVTYRHAGGGERLDELRSLCRLCHDAVTMIEYGLGMGLDRINPEEPRWRDLIIEKRQEIVNYRSLETRRRRLSAEEVE